MGHRRLTKRVKPDLVSVLTGLLLCVYVIGLFFPMLWALFVSFVEAESYFDFFTLKSYSGSGFPFEFTLENYMVAWENLAVTATTSGIEYNVVSVYIHSLLYASVSALAFTFCTTMVSYLTAKFDFKLSKLVYAFVILAMSLPIIGSMPSEIRMLRNLGIYDSWISLPILRFNFLSVYYLVLFATFRGISKEYSEAAKIDGASNLRIMLKIVMPQALNIVVTVFVLTFITYWNDYQIPMLYLPSYPVSALAVYNLMTIEDPDFAAVYIRMAGTILMVLPIVAFVIAFNKRLRVSVSIGGIKG